MKSLLLAALVVGLVSASPACTLRGCGAGRPALDAGRWLPPPTLRLVFVTDLKGYLEPCGCTVRPLGGVHRLGGTLDRLRRDGAPTAFVAVGDLFVDPAAGPDRATQDRFQAETLRDALQELRIDALVPGRVDRSRGDDFLVTLLAGKGLPVLASGPELPETLGAAPHRIVTLGAVRLGLVAASDAFGADVASVTAEVASTREAGAQVVVALVRGDRRFARSIAAIPGVDFLVHGGLDAETPEPPSERGSTVVLEGGRQGQRAVVLNLYRRDGSRFRDESPWTRTVARERLTRDRAERAAQIATWEREGRTAAELADQRATLADLERRIAATRVEPDVAGGNAFVAEAIELAAGTPEHAGIAARMEAHGIRVNDHNRVAFADALPPPAEPGMPSYVGTETCRSCHGSPYAWWSNHPHSRAYATLTTRHREYNLACVGCHVTGYGRPSGATVTHNLEGRLVNVGCESCHGPGSEHAANPTGATHSVTRAVPETVCVRCHNHEHSDHFDYAAYLRAIVVPGHGLPLGGGAP